ncbi:serine/threonine-protein kinase [Planotetraspora mira]|uniref:non-specific serine/threonine protein kinase n=1 Tax=Planotetraspora mira TaxID=58121 RepID=A0A8J3TN52_9ACTN|nr:serine/threonine-protein kinase [Planotetraspora mira]GII28931.1 hypothetical protein Pmi06nite_23730 [Planotetraspora mira]
MTVPGEWRVPGYAEVRALGSGDDGRVVLAVEETSGSHVAIRYLPEETRTEPGFAERFRADFRLLADLDDPHVARVHEYADGPHGAAVVMEPVNGASLRAVLREESPIAPRAALVLFKDSLLGLAAAHEAGVVHGDHKPEHVLVQGDGASKLVGFGLAVRTGTPAYLAPEVRAGKPASAASDMYAATAVLRECLTGRLPGGRRSHAASRQVPVPLRDLVERGLAGDPELRPPSAAMFVAELDEVASAACGAAWEQRGRRAVADLAAPLAPTFPLNRPPLDRPPGVLRTMAAAVRRNRFGKAPARHSRTD